jgi:kinase-associated protein B
MTDKQLTIGDIVQANYRAGGYIGEVVEIKPTKAVVKILAVVKHPTQGDLHNPYEADVPMFHQRRALAYQEKALVPLAHINEYSGDIPEYSESLQQAVEAEIASLRKKSGPWAEKSIEELEKLKKEYFPGT